MGPLDSGRPDRAPGREPRKARRKLPALLRVVVACLVMATLFWWIGPAEVLQRFAALPAGVAFIGLAGALIAQWVGSVRLKWVAYAHHLRLSVAEAWSINLSAVFYGLFLPGGNATGWAVRLIRLSPGMKGIGGAVLALGSDRVSATVTLAGFGVVTDLLLRCPAGAPVTVVLFVVTLITALLFLILFNLLPAGIAETWVRSRVARRLAGFMARQDQPLPRRHSGAAAGSILLSACMHVIGIGVWFILSRALGIEVGLLSIAWLRSAAMVIALLPVSVGGLGLREGATVYFLSFFDVAAADALSLSLAVFAVTVLAVGLVGGLGELWRWLAPPGSRRVN